MTAAKSRSGEGAEAGAGAMLVAYRLAGLSALGAHYASAASDLIAAAATLTEAVASGEVTPGEAASLSVLVGNTAKAVETFELSERLARIEERLASQGSAP